MKIVRIEVEVPEEPGYPHPVTLGRTLEGFCLEKGLTPKVDVFDPRDREAVGEGP
jgi:hypothetical protein